MSVVNDRTARTAPDLPDSQRIEIRAGRVLSVAHHTGTSDRCVFLCHGAGGNKNQWRFQWRALVDAGHSVVAWDCYGHGASPQPHEFAAYRGDTLVDDYAALFERFAARRNVLVGHSYGTRLTLSLLARFAQKGPSPGVEQVVLIGPPPLHLPPVGGFFRWAPAFVLELIRPQLSSRFRALAWHPETDPALIRAEERLTAGNSLFMMRALIQQSVTPDLAALAATTTRFLVLTGDHDQLTPPAAGQELAQHLPNATFRVIDRSGHQAMLEQPDAVNAAILEVIENG
jgi:pimeloyl-ACP methyl ester carboxylesterase